MNEIDTAETDLANIVTDAADTDNRATPETVETETGDTDTFSRTYVEKLRDENAKLRMRAQHTDELSHRLHRALVEQTGKLADPSDLDFDPDHLDDSEKLITAVDSLIAAKPHLRSRTPKGDVGQGNRGPAEASVNLLDILKSRV